MFHFFSWPELVFNDVMLHSLLPQLCSFPFSANIQAAGLGHPLAMHATELVLTS